MDAMRARRVAGGWPLNTWRRRGVLSTTAGAIGLGVGARAGAVAGMALRPAPRSQTEGSPPGGGTVVTRWNEAALEAIRTVRPAPTVASRALAVLHTAIYEAWAAYHPVAVGTQTGSALRRPAGEHVPANQTAAIDAAAHEALTRLFPAQSGAFDALLARSLSAGEAYLAAQTGREAAAAVLEFRLGDGANQSGGYADTSDYAPVNTADAVLDPDRWQPLRVPDGAGGFRVQQYVTPHWGLVRPFGLRSGSEVRPQARPHAFPEAGYVDQAAALLELSATLGDREKAIAEYWSDGPSTETPPGHWCALAQWVSRRDGHDLDADVRLFFALGNALLDAGVAAWDAKRHFDYVRPVTAIRYLFSGRAVRAWAGPNGGTRTIDGGTWHPYQARDFVTPAFPECVSGHSTFSAAAAEVLRRFTGSDAFGASVAVGAGSSRIEPGATPSEGVLLEWDTFSAAAAEAGLSRRYGGIHFEDGDLMGRAMGRAVGAAAWDGAEAHWRGDA